MVREIHTESSHALTPSNSIHSSDSRGSNNCTPISHRALTNESWRVYAYSPADQELLDRVEYSRWFGENKLS